MALLKSALLIAIIIMTVCIMYCTGTLHCQGTECSPEDLQSDSNAQLLQALNATVGSILQNELKIHVTLENQQDASCTPQSTPTQANPETPTRYPQDCTEIASRGYNSSGYYKIWPKITILPATEDTAVKSLDVYCDMDTEGGGWTVFQHRKNGAVDFYRDWEEYKNGFGYLEGDYWLGLENIHRLTAVAAYELRIDLEDFDGNTAYAHYDQFHVKDEGTLYKLYVGTYQGTAGDDLRLNINQPFSTKDQDHDSWTGGNCATNRKGAWWYESCGWSNLNGLYLGPLQSTNTGIRWYHWKDSEEVLKGSQMKIRRIDE